MLFFHLNSFIQASLAIVPSTPAKGTCSWWSLWVLALVNGLFLAEDCKTLLAFLKMLVEKIESDINHHVLSGETLVTVAIPGQASIILSLVSFFFEAHIHTHT